MARRFPLYHYAIGAAAAVFALNLMVRVLLKLGGYPATLVVAVLVALGLRGLFQHLEGHRPSHAEAWGLNLLYAGVLGLLYLGLWGLMWLKDEPGHMGQLIFVLHYLTYPAALAFCLHLPGRR